MSKRSLKKWVLWLEQEELVFIDSYCNHLRYRIHSIQFKSSKLTITKWTRVLKFSFEKCHHFLCSLRKILDFSFFFFSYYSRSDFSTKWSYKNLCCSSPIVSGAAQPNLVVHVPRALNNQGRHGKTPYFSGWNKPCQFFRVIVLSPGALTRLCWYGILSFATFPWITPE